MRVSRNRSTLTFISLIVMTRKHHVKCGLQPHDPKETRIKKLVGYIKARVEECKDRPSISLCAYTGFTEGGPNLLAMVASLLICNGTKRLPAEYTSSSSTTSMAHTLLCQHLTLHNASSSVRSPCQRSATKRHTPVLYKTQILDFVFVSWTCPKISDCRSMIQLCS